jgi:aerobic C4-dicarboxylate transport protein
MGKKLFTNTLSTRVVVGIVAGVTVGILFPHFGAKLQPIGDAFIKLIRMLIAPIIFLTVVLGISSLGSLRQLGRIGIKALVYFEIVTTIALLMGIVSVKLIRPGQGMNINVATLDAASVQHYATAKHLGLIDFLLNMIPDNLAGAFVNGEILQVLLVAILTGMALLMLGGQDKLLELAHQISTLLFKMIAIIMEFSPLASFGALAFTIGRFGFSTLFPLVKVLLCVYLTGGIFVAVVLGGICLLNGISLIKLIRFLDEELLIVFATSSTEPVLPRLILKMEQLGCGSAVCGLVIPAGYSFNLDGTSIYLSVAVLFVAQATNTHLSVGQQIFLFLMLMLNSKGAAAVTGGGFITLAATMAAVGTIPVAGLALLLGIDRFMSEARSMVNLIGNAVATTVIARWEGTFDQKRAQLVLDGLKTPELIEDPYATCTEELG